MKAKTVPNKHICHKHGWQFATSIEARPQRYGDPVNGQTIVQVNLPCGDTCFFGVDRAWINSALRMCAEGGFVNERNELVRAWKDAE